MIKTIGFTRFFVITLFAVFLMACLLYIYKITGPNLEKEKRKLNGVNSEISRMTNDIDDLSKGLAQFQKQKEAFYNVQNFGFFDDQNRVNATQLIKAMQKESRLLSAVYSISPARIVADKRASDSEHDLLSTDIKFSIEAIEDADVYKFIYLLNYGFPGQININSLSISREEKITQPLLRQIGIGQPSPIIKADLEVSWQSMVPAGRLPQNINQSNGGRG